MAHTGNGMSRRAVVGAMAAATGAAFVPIGAAAAGGGPARPAPGAARAAQVIPALTSTALAFTHLPGAAFRASASADPWTSDGATITAGAPTTLHAALVPGTAELWRELDVWVAPAGQPGTVSLRRHRPGPPSATDVLAAAPYPGTGGPHRVVVPLDHRSDPMDASYVVSVEVGAGTVLHGAQLWYFPLRAGFVQLPSARAYDSRLAGGKLDSGEVRSISLERVLTQVPGSALVNLTVDQTEGRGYLTAWSPTGEDGSPPPGTSNVNWSGDGQTLANLAVVKLVGDHSDAFSVLVGGPGRTHLVVDVLGYFT